MASKKKSPTATPPSPVPAAVGDAGEGQPVAPPPEMRAPGASVTELDDALTAAPAAKDAAGAAAAFQQAEIFATSAPAATQDAKRGRGRPAGSRTKPNGQAGRQAPPTSPASASPPRDYSRMTKAELIASVQQLSARVDAMNPTGAPGSGEIVEARKTVEGLLELANLALALRNVPEFVTTKEENGIIADAAAEPIAPYLRQLGAAQPWVRLGGALIIVYGPKLSSYMERREAEKLGKPVGKKEIVVSESDARTMSGGFDGAPTDAK